MVSEELLSQIGKTMTNDEVVSNRILVLHVDDEQSFLDLTKQYLKGISKNIIIDPVLSPQTVFNYLTLKQYDMIVADYQMPGMTGLELLAELRTRGNPIPFIILTGRGREEVVIQALNLGADFYLQKTGEPQVLFRELAHVISKVAENQRYSRALQAFNECRQVIVHATHEKELLQKICQIIVDIGGYRLAWVGLAEQKLGKMVRPIAQAGFEEGYLDSVRITWDDTKYGAGPTGTAIKINIPSIMQDILNDPTYEPWRTQALKRGYASSIALPLNDRKKPFGAFNIYSSEPQAFYPDEVQLLSSLADDLAHGYIALKNQTRLKRKKQQLQHLIAVLDAVRSVNQLIVKEKNCDALLQGACDIFVNTREFEGAWIILLDEAGKCVRTTQAGLGRQFLSMVEHLKHKGLPRCVQEALLKSGVIETQNILSFCNDCPLSPRYCGNRGMSTRLEYNAKIYGVLIVFFPPDISRDNTELILFQEVAKDIAFALHNLNLEERNKQMEEELRRSETRYRNLFEESPVSLWEADYSKVKEYLNNLRLTGVKDLRKYLEEHSEVVDKCTSLVKVLDVNQATLDLFKVRRKEELIGILDKFLMKGSNDLLKKELVTLVEGKNKLTFETFATNLEGERMCLNIGLSVSSGYEDSLSRVIRSVLDITDRKQAEEVLVKAKDMLAKKVEEATHTLFEEKKCIETIVETIPDGILVVDTQGDIYLVNKVFTEYYQRIYHKDLPTTLQDLLILANPFGDTISELFYSKKERTIIIEPVKGLYLQLASSLLTIPPATPLGIVITVRDVTSFVEVDTFRKQFVSIVSHELRTPITAINLSLRNLQQFKKRMSEDQYDAIIDMTVESAQVLTQLVEDLLIASRIEADQITLEWTPYQLLKVVQGALTVLAPRLSAKSINAEVDVNADIQLFGDEKRINQIFRILIDNAIKYSEKHSTVHIKAIDHYQGPFNPHPLEGTLIQIIDSGRGIREEDLPYIFDRFFRSSDVSDKQGSGLGLSIAQELIKLHQGAIFVESQYGKGSIFSVFLPRMEQLEDDT